jgi:DNA-directed RNA polymerase specialized sigma24 family protein
MLYPMLNMNTEIVALIPAIRAVIAKTLRSSRYYTDDHIEECLGDILTQALDYGVRTFDPSKGNARSHFTCFARCRALNWLTTKHRRFETAMPLVRDLDGGTLSFAESLPAESDVRLDMVRSQEIERVRAAVASLRPEHRAVAEAFMRTQSWTDAAREVGVSVAMASRTKAALAKLLK